MPVAYGVEEWRAQASRHRTNVRQQQQHTASQAGGRMNVQLLACMHTKDSCTGFDGLNINCVCMHAGLQWVGAAENTP